MTISVSMLQNDTIYNLGLELLAGEAGLDNLIEHTRIQKPGLAIAGLVQAILPGHIQVLGNTEMHYIRSLEPIHQMEALSGLLCADIPCVIITTNLEAPLGLYQLANKGAIPLFKTPLTSGLFINKIHDFLDEHISPQVTMHGVLVDVFGVGILLTGQSGIGKSECALDLILRSHRLVADDIVLIRKRDHNLMGRGSPIIKNHMEVRGLGIINVKDLFGAASVCECKRIGLIVEMIEWHKDAEYDRLGIDALDENILGILVPQVRLPIRPGRNVASIIEVAARNHLLKQQGHHSALKFKEYIESNLKNHKNDNNNEGHA